MSTFSQNAKQTNRPEEFVEEILLGIPPNADVENPADDAAFMEKIGATLKSPTSETKYEMQNAATGTMFTFEWAVSGIFHLYWTVA